MPYSFNTNFIKHRQFHDALSIFIPILTSHTLFSKTWYRCYYFIYKNNLHFCSKIDFKMRAVPINSKTDKGMFLSVHEGGPQL